MQDKFKAQRNKSICLNYFTVFVLVVWLINSYHTLKKKTRPNCCTQQNVRSFPLVQMIWTIMCCHLHRLCCCFLPILTPLKWIPSNISSPQSSVLPLASYPQLHPFSLKYHFPSSASPIMVPNFQHIPLP